MPAMDAPLPPFDVNLSILFTELPLLERPAAAASAGFDAVELWWPFSVPTPADDELDALERALRDAGTQLVGLNFDAGDMPGGDRGLLSLPSQSQRFRDNVDVAVGLAERTGCRVLNALYGNRQDGVDPAEQDELGTENLTLAAAAAARIGATVVIESLNSYEAPRYPLLSAADAVAVIDRVPPGSGRLGYLCDLYHLARMGEDLPAVIARYADRIVHVQIADNPERHEPGTGELDFPALFAALHEAAYTGYVGLEYKPSTTSVASFGWLSMEHRSGRVSPITEG